MTIEHGKVQMRIIVSGIYCIALLMIISPIMAEELKFPQTIPEIVEALQFKQGKMTVDGIDYEVERNRVYRIINGKRFQLRGIQIMEASGLTPKVGALIYFDTDSAKIKPESSGLLDQFGIAFANDLRQATVVITGHTDSRGPDGYNQGLSEKRARAVANYLRARFPIAPERISCIGFGETKPLADNATKSGQAINRRVEFIRIR